MIIIGNGRRKNDTSWWCGMYLMGGVRDWNMGIEWEGIGKINKVKGCLFERKNIFMKDNISRKKNLMCADVEKFVSLNSIGIANEQAFSSSRIKFGSTLG